MTRAIGRAFVLAAAASLFAASAGAQGADAEEPAAKPPANADTPPQGVIEPRALELLKAASERLTAAQRMTFTAVVFYESPSKLGPPLIYATESQVMLQRPDKLRVITVGDGPPSEFYVNGTTITAFSPQEGFVAVGEGPPTIDGALETAYRTADIYFPFTDVVVEDPYREISRGLQQAFVMGQSNVVGGTKTDIVVFVSDYAFVQIWIGANDHLPRMLRAVFRDDPLQLRHQLELSNWKLDGTIPVNAFASSRAAAAKKVPFARPSTGAGRATPPKEEPPKTDGGSAP